MRESQSTLIPVDELSVLSYLHLLEYVYDIQVTVNLLYTRYTGETFHFSTVPSQWKTDIQFEPKPKLMKLSELGLKVVLENLHLYDNVDLFSKQFIVNQLATDPQELEKQTQYWLTGDVSMDAMAEVALELIPAADEFMLTELASMFVMVLR